MVHKPLSVRRLGAYFVINKQHVPNYSHFYLDGSTKRPIFAHVIKKPNKYANKRKETD